jgi:AcrR family transcriptional regulator
VPAPAPQLRRRRPAEERRAQILQAAARCFSTRGFVATTTRDIAARVGITEAALYRHFPSKEAMYTALLDERLAAPDPVTPLEAAAAAGDDEAVFGGLARSLLESVEEDPTFLRLLLFSALEGHELARPFREKRVRRLREFLAGYIERRIRDGAFRRVDPLLAARAFVGMVIDHLIVRQVFGQRDEAPAKPAAVAKAFVSVFLDGVREPLPRRAARRNQRG